MNPLNSEIAQAIASELDDAGYAYTKAYGSKHPRFVVDVQGRSESIIFPSSASDVKAKLNAVAFVRRKIAEWNGAGKEPAPMAVVDVPHKEITVTIIDGEPRVLDILVAERLGFERPRKIRELIERNLEEIEVYGVCPTVGKTSGPRGGRPTKEYWLNEEQALLVSVLARTPKAAEVRRALIQSFMTYRHQPVISAPVEMGDLIAASELTLDGIGRIEQAIAGLRQAEIIHLPSWEDNARSMRREGMTYREIADRLGRREHEVARAVKNVMAEAKWQVIAGKASRGVMVTNREWYR